MSKNISVGWIPNKKLFFDATNDPGIPVPKPESAKPSYVQIILPKISLGGI